MSKTVNILENQTLFDVALRQLGSVEAVFDIARDNDVAVTDMPDSVQIDEAVQDRDLINWFDKQSVQFATGDNSVEPSEGGSGSDTYIEVKLSQPEPGYEVRQNQNLFDIALQIAGGVEAAFELSQLNNINISSELYGGMVLSKDINVLNKRIARFYDDNAFKPGTAQLPEAIGSVQDGIGYWAIEIDFEVG
jgi:hypothetical protein